MEKAKGGIVSFEQPVQLLHIASNRFISCHYENAAQETENFKLDFDDFASEYTVWKFMTTASYQRDTERVIYIGDTVNISSSMASQVKNPFVHCATQKSKKKVVAAADDSDEDIRIQEMPQRSTSRRRLKIGLNLGDSKKLAE